MNNSITLISGGVGSGKTSHALLLASPSPQKVYIATAPRQLDAEMDTKIRNHEAERDDSYQTLEEAINLAAALRQAQQAPAQVIILDCLTLWASNLLFGDCDPEFHVEEFLSELSATAKPIIIVTNEVNLGVIPADSTTRRYCALLARINRRVAAVADTVLFMVSGLPIVAKGIRQP